MSATDGNEGYGVTLQELAELKRTHFLQGLRGRLEYLREQHAAGHSVQLSSENETELSDQARRFLGPKEE